MKSKPVDNFYFLTSNYFKQSVTTLIFFCKVGEKGCKKSVAGTQFFSPQNYFKQIIVIYHFSLFLQKCVIFFPFFWINSTECVPLRLTGTSTKHKLLPLSCACIKQTSMQPHGITQRARWKKNVKYLQFKFENFSSPRIYLIFSPQNQTPRTFSSKIHVSASPISSSSSFQINHTTFFHDSVLLCILALSLEYRMNKNMTRAARVVKTACLFFRTTRRQ